MGAGRRTQTFLLNESTPSFTNQAMGAVTLRNLRKNHLGGIIFGCTNSTIKECLFKQLFGLPSQHFSYIKNIDPGLPLFLFNYNDRKLHGIFEAASSGQMNINPYAWTTDGSERTPYPAQVQVRIRLQSHPLSEEQFKPIILDNYFKHSHFWFELDHAQTSTLLSLLSSQAVDPSAVRPQNSKMWRTLFRAPPSHYSREETEGFEPPVLDVDFPQSHMSNELGTSDFGKCLDANNHPMEDCSGKQVVENEEYHIYMKLKELTQNKECSDLPFIAVNAAAAVSGHLGQLKAPTNSEEMNEESLVNSSDYPFVIAQLVQEIKELKTFKKEQIQSMSLMEKKLVEAETAIGKLKQRCVILESLSHPSARVDEMEVNSVEPLDLDLNESLFLVGGYDGVNWLSTLDAYSPTRDVIKSLKPMNFVRSYASVAKLNGEIYAFGGGNGSSSSWYDAVESYDPVKNEWALHPSLNREKGSLAGVTLNDKIFAIGGGNGLECFDDVEMYDLDVGRWIITQSMLQKRFALAAVELNGALYAVGGYDGKDYLMSAERFDPREHSWKKIEPMNTKRGCHAMVVLNEKLYVIGGYDGNEMVASVEIYDPRLDSWMVGEPMNHSRGYSAAAVFKESIFVLGGVKSGGNIVDTVECYQDGQGWRDTDLSAMGKRSFFSTIAL